MADRSLWSRKAALRHGASISCAGTTRRLRANILRHRKCAWPPRSLRPPVAWSKTNIPGRNVECPRCRESSLLGADWLDDRCPEHRQRRGRRWQTDHRQSGSDLSGRAPAFKSDPPRPVQTGRWYKAGPRQQTLPLFLIVMPLSLRPTRGFDIPPGTCNEVACFCCIVETKTTGT
jgi:hypothetical protein